MDKEFDEEFFMDGNSINIGLRIDNELFKEEDCVPQQLIQVRRIDSKKEGEVWRIFDNKKLAITIAASRFTNAEKEYLRTQNGFLYLINGYKNGWRSINKFKKNIKVHDDNSRKNKTRK